MVTSSQPAVPASTPLQPGQAYEVHQDFTSPNRNLTPVGTCLDGQGRLQVGGCTLSHLAHTYGTPLYVLDEATLRATA